MKPTLKPGLAATKKLTVDEPRVINFMGEDCRVYATPRIISDVEYTCRDFLLGHLDPGEDSVGTKANWEHVGPALLGAEITISIKLIKVEGRRLTFDAAVSDAAEQRGSDVVPVDLGADRVLPRVEVSEQEIPAGVF